MFFPKEILAIILDHVNGYDLLDIKSKLLNEEINRNINANKTTNEIITSIFKHRIINSLKQVFGTSGVYQFLDLLMHNDGLIAGSFILSMIAGDIPYDDMDIYIQWDKTYKSYHYDNKCSNYGECNDKCKTIRTNNCKMVNYLKNISILSEVDEEGHFYFDDTIFSVDKHNDIKYVYLFQIFNNSRLHKIQLIITTGDPHHLIARSDFECCKNTFYVCRSARENNACTDGINNDRKGGVDDIRSSKNNCGESDGKNNDGKSDDGKSDCKIFNDKFNTKECESIDGEKYKAMDDNESDNTIKSIKNNIKTEIYIPYPQSICKRIINVDQSRYDHPIFFYYRIAKYIEKGFKIISTNPSNPIFFYKHFTHATPTYPAYRNKIIDYLISHGYISEQKNGTDSKINTIDTNDNVYRVNLEKFCDAILIENNKLALLLENNKPILYSEVMKFINTYVRVKMEPITKKDICNNCYWDRECDSRL